MYSRWYSLDKGGSAWREGTNRAKSVGQRCGCGRSFSPRINAPAAGAASVPPSRHSAAYGIGSSVPGRASAALPAVTSEPRIFSSVDGDRNPPLSGDRRVFAIFWHGTCCSADLSLALAKQLLDSTAAGSSCGRGPTGPTSRPAPGAPSGTRLSPPRITRFLIPANISSTITCAAT